jgi:hypothetical protein
MEGEAMKLFKVVTFLMALLWSSAALADVTIDANSALYSNVPAAQGVNINSEDEIRQAAMLALVGAYRVVNGVTSIPNNTQVQIIYQGGSKEKALVICMAGTPCVVPVQGTKEAASGDTGGGGGGGGEGGGVGGGWGGGGAGDWGPGPGDGGGAIGCVTVGETVYCQIV